MSGQSCPGIFYAMQEEVKMREQELLYKMPKELDHHCAKMLIASIDNMVDKRGVRRLVLDFEETCFMDSSGIGVIIGRSRKMKFLDGELVVCGVTPRIERIFEASGLYKIVKVRE